MLRKKIIILLRMLCSPLLCGHVILYCTVCSGTGTGTSPVQSVRRHSEQKALLFF